MRILVDEDMASRDLLARLEAILPGDVLIANPGSSDAEVWNQAQDEGAAVLTGTVIDFMALARTAASHHGLLLRYRSDDATRDMRTADVADAIRAIDRTFPNGIDALVLAVNHFIDLM